MICNAHLLVVQTYARNHSTEEVNKKNVLWQNSCNCKDLLLFLTFQCCSKIQVCWTKPKFLFETWLLAFQNCNNFTGMPSIISENVKMRSSIVPRVASRQNQHFKLQLTEKSDHFDGHVNWPVAQRLADLHFSLRAQHYKSFCVRN
jgi:hypothetical protein